ncbi:spermidine synthase [Archaeoglobus sp.]|uniref:spermidine synthase n=1 Tax=Archaeoglobus sp. TaxID=1872626 RepID=UPI0024ABF882|nr:spermidine synthase [Archaeoglobus sp.]MDI3498941.1 spermidine synthase [Archaeoglobus sp.]
MVWFFEYYDGCGLAIKVKKKLYEAEGVQKVEIYETESMGKMLVIDGKIQLTELDEPFYHEMLVHVPMLSHENPRKVAVIGGGDGGALREVLKHNVERAVLVDIDRNVIDLSRKFLKIDHGAFEDERVEIAIMDGKEFLRDCEIFDVIIVDSTDPVGVSDTLFDREFFELARQKCDVISLQSQSPLIQKEYFRTLLVNSAPFERRDVYLSCVPTYPLALWSFIIGGEYDFSNLEERFERIKGTTVHYNPDVHRAAFALPEWLKKEVEACI